jgi:uncharacterized small protein (DUF1192 family)
MKKYCFVVLLFSHLGWSQEQVELPPRPTCTPLFSGGACQSQWNQYNQAVYQAQQANYQQRVKAWADQRNQEEQATVEALNQRIAGLQSQVERQLNELETNKTTSNRMLDEAHQSAWYGIAVVGLIALALGFGVGRATKA